MISIAQEQHGEDVTGDELFVCWLSPWHLRRTITGYRWFRYFGEFGYRISYRRLHKGPRV